MHIAINNSKLDISNINTTKKLAEDFINHLKRGSSVCLYGEIGVGKTTFVKHFINAYQKYKNLQITNVTSPTFSLLNEYQIGELIIKHYDLYRLKSKSEIKNLDLFEINNNIITFIEWPELIDKKKLLNNVDLIFSYENNLNDRFIKISGLT
jgi:tRNA threonylcarbamoyladenosine biosynthesis protein TsaE